VTFVPGKKVTLRVVGVTSPLHSVLIQKLVPKMDRRLLYTALFGRSAALESHDKAIVEVNAKNVAVAGQTTALLSRGAAAWYGVWSQLGNSVVAMTADELEDIAHVSERIDAKASPSV
jgi:hypothetical protein